MSSATRAERAALRRDLVWAILWGLRSDDGWATTAKVWQAWLGRRDPSGIRFADDYIGDSGQFAYMLRRLVADGRAERRKLPHRHPQYRALAPTLEAKL